jgi:hypothetical protein
VKKSSTGSSSNDGEFVTSIRTSAPARASARPAPVSTSAPVERDAATTWWPAFWSSSTTFAPTCPVAPMTVIRALFVIF